MPDAPEYRIRASAPLRVNLAGGGSDLPLFADEWGGAAAVVAVRLSAHVEVLLGGRTIRLRAEDRDEHITLSGAADIVYDGRLDRLKAALNMLPVTGGIEILTRSDAPPGAGLGGRGALDVALIAALAHCRDERFEPTEVAEIACQLEARELRCVVGREAPYAAALGGMQQLAITGDSVTVRAVGDDTLANELSGHLVLVHPGRAYPAETLHRKIVVALESGDANVRGALAALRDLVDPVVQAVEAGDWPRLGQLFDEVARHHAAFDPLWQAPPTAGLAQVLRDAGAWGVKPAGPRPGASLVAIAAPQRVPALRTAAQAAGGVPLPCDIVTMGVRVWREEVVGT